MDLNNVIAFNAAFDIVSVETGEVLVEATEADAKAIQALIDADEFAPGVMDVADAMADALTDAMVDGTKVRVRVGSAATGLAIFDRIDPALAMLANNGVRDVDDLIECVEYELIGEDDSVINNAEMAVFHKGTVTLIALATAALELEALQATIN